MSTPIEQAGALVIGTVSSVSPNEVKVLLDHDAPQATALNTGTPTPFPRINGYVLIPNETGAVVGLVSWIGIEHSAFPKRTGLKDFGLIDLPYPTRKMSLMPVGTLVSKREAADHEYIYRLERGVFVFPSVGDPVQLPTNEQLRSIVEATGADRRVPIGIAPLAGNAVVSVDPDKLFGRHLAVLGNTGSGKSCTLAGIIRWSLNEACKERERLKKEGKPNARFIILDPNGEYTEAFSDLGCRVFRVPPVTPPVKPLTVPAWMWNSQEWSTLSMAAPGAQRPLLLQALRELRAGAAVVEPAVSRVGRRFRAYKAQLQQRIVDSAFLGVILATNLLNIVKDAATYAGETEGQLAGALQDLAATAQATADAHYYEYTPRGGAKREGYNDFSETDVQNVLQAIDQVLGHIPPSDKATGPSEDAPVPFVVTELPGHLEHLAGEIGTGQVGTFIATLAMRIRLLLADRRLGPLVAPESPVTLDKWLEDYVGEDQATNGPIAVLDLSLVPSDVLHITIAVIARLIFEAIQRYRKLHGEELPTVLVLEESHNFVQRLRRNEDDTSTSTSLCRHVFERIAREGRKFGLGLVLASQRPNELSPTVLGQCNTFILHRIVNDQDQDLVGRLVPDNLGGLLRDLPSLPARQAILLGSATAVPVLVEINELSKEQCPKSSDPRFWDTWTGQRVAPIDWNAVAQDWST